ncbi:MAG: ATP-binding protein [Microcoleus sp. PH2017_10_PVI_O_A]|uniref:ATP-binding protein n=1 Tax=unclassified Microcoleus TaxID=2642155 RepID=UPI001D7EAEB2|nr:MULTISPECIES: ATP-binding protein [unclassified Microcoleus]TAE84509.1 MAG: ATP-binding protein [Oscillatoriales cyanobacterium]MCC3405143.1 ATP-binding protein [Microcoleus sp. PH2017_10_PVI_O_A]MCC3459229.1 ATP-binding protein [Microcoleus sp. PH2017_11_PCY_U_A]MCC3477455.1 ATP-binding protein [Microcoleus sp. PH2017_12_PCY_D_A]MCC3528683.1 ATP-binding protein [Microcoleus sp. PH2017_21_RUC_O_A]
MIELQGSEKLQPLKKAALQVNTGQSALEPVLSWFAQLYEQRIPTSVWIRCQLALAEGFTNAVRHAHEGQRPDLPVEIDVLVSAESVEIKIWDSGPPFDLDQKIQDMSKTIDPEASGGRGLKLMKDIADSLSYTRTADGRNCLSIVKNYTPIPDPADEDDILQLPDELLG